MAKLQYKNGQTSVVLRVKIMDAASTTGAGKTNLSSSSTGLIISTIADNENTATAYTQGAGTIESITTLGVFAAPTAGKCRFREVDPANHPGLYEIQIADARWAVSNARSVVVTVSGASGAAQVDAEIQLTAVDPQDGVRGGMTSLPNANASAANGLPTLDGSSHLLVYSVSQGVTVAANNDKTGYSLSVSPPTAAAIATAIWTDTTSSDFAAAGSPGKAIKDNLDASVSSRSSLDAAAVRAAVGLASANLDTQLAALPTTAGITSSVLTTAMAESYAADGATMTVAQGLYMIWSALGQFGVSGTSLTCKKLDGSTTSMVFTLDDATNPTARTRSS